MVAELAKEKSVRKELKNLDPLSLPFTPCVLSTAPDAEDHPFSVILASNDLLTDFCGARSIAGIRLTSKSSLHRVSTFFTDEQLCEFNTALVECIGSAASSAKLGLGGY